MFFEVINEFMIQSNAVSIATTIRDLQVLTEKVFY